ncbi:MAG: hypothetical protein MRY83_19270 [Flavobacteriales bacterium]|nr:hypothetical protein [Flavobacteriales bacterium]
MLGFKVVINGQVLCKAGFSSKNHVITCIADSVKRKSEDQDLVLSIAGLDSDEMEHVKWNQRNLKKGDIIQIEVIDKDFDPPAEVTPKKSEEDEIKSKLEYYKRLKEELRDYL